MSRFAASPFTMRHLRLALRFFYWLGFAFGLGISVLGLLAPIYPGADLVNHFRPMILAACVPLIALGYAAWRAWPKTGLALAAGQIVLAMPALWMTSALPGGAHAGASVPVTVLSLNLWVRHDVDAIVRLLDQTAPDLVMLQEVSPSTLPPLLRAIGERYPHVAECACDVALLSKRPLRDIETHDRASAHPSLVTALWTSPGGRTYRVGSLHLAWPFLPQAQATNVDWLADAAARWREPLILGGDYNLSPWSYKMSRLTWRSGLTRQGLWGASWPAPRGIVPRGLVLIDNVLTSPEIFGERFVVGPSVGSDHLPVIATLKLPG
jgi:endonuclease/exonuclease/phosphatase (EEP) superfamily protein YafD